MTATVDPVTERPYDSVNEMLPPGRLFTLGLQHVLVMYAGAIAVPLIVGRVLQLSPWCRSPRPIPAWRARG